MTRLLLIVFLVASNVATSQSIFSINDKKISVEDFIHVFEKNKTSQFSEEVLSIEEYLDLYLNFHLKVYEAEQLGIPNEEKFEAEFARFYKQLADNHIANGDVTEEMIQEVYQRLTTEVKVSHILINLPQDVKNPKTDAYKKALAVLEELENGGDFIELAEKHSQDPSVKMNKGDMGWFKAFKMVTPFENESYALEVGEISMPVETQFGYHIIKKTDERPSMGKILVSQIMLYTDTKNKEEKQLRIEEIYQRVIAGESFEELAKQFSEDTNTAEKGGVMLPFEIGSLNSQSFENEAFSLSENGQFSMPFKTKFGWHIVKRLDSEPVAPYQEMKQFLSKKIKTSDRAKLLNNRIQQKLGEFHSIELNKDAILHFEKETEGLIQKSKWEYTPNAINANKIAFQIDEKTFSWEDLGNYLQQNQRGIELAKPSKTVVRDLTNAYLYNELVEAHKLILMDIDPAFKALVREYRDGLLLYEIMEQAVWNKAKNDSLGIQQFFDANRNKYLSEPEVQVEIISARDKKEAKKIKKKLNKGFLATDLTEEFPEAIFSAQEWKKKSNTSLPQNLYTKNNRSKIYLHNKQHLVIRVTNIKSSTNLPLENVKGKVISDYQEMLEKEWVVGLKEKYSVSIDEQVVENLKQRLE